MSRSAALLLAGGVTVVVSGCATTVFSRVADTQATSGAQGTIVIEQTRENFGFAHQGPGQTELIQTITETSASGNEQRVFSSSSQTKPGYQQLNTGDLLELYDPADNTIYVTTERGWQAAVRKQTRQNTPKGTSVRTSTVTFYGSASPTPGKMSVVEQQWRKHLYRLDGQTTIGGRPVMKLVPVHDRVRLAAHSSQLFPTAYVAPGTWDPIREVLRLPGPTGPGTFSASEVTNWVVYKVVPATPANQWLVSLTARHPGARVVNNGTAYLRASDSSNKR